MTRIWLIRHAASTSKPGIAVGATDPPLSALGRTQAEELARRLTDRPLVAVWSSDRLRAVETARRMAAPHDLRVAVRPALREIHFGSWEGRDLSGLWTEDPDSARRWEADVRQTPHTFGESVSDLERRVRLFWTEAYPAAAAGETAVVAHRGSLAALRSILTGSSFARSFEVGLDVAGVEGIDVTLDSERAAGSPPFA